MKKPHSWWSKPKPKSEKVKIGEVKHGKEVWKSDVFIYVRGDREADKKNA